MDGTGRKRLNEFSERVGRESQREWERAREKESKRERKQEREMGGGALQQDLSGTLSMWFSFRYRP